MHCDMNHKHRIFEWGYLIIMGMNSIIMTSVALYSTIWSITLSNKQALGLPVKWQWLLVAIILITGVSAILIYFESKSNGNIFRTFV